MCLPAAAQEAAIGSCMMHPNIVSVYSISLRPSSLPGPLPATAPSGGSSAPGLLLLREDGTALVRSSDLAAAAAASREGALDLLPWCMQLVMELCDKVSEGLLVVPGFPLPGLPAQGQQPAPGTTESLQPPLLAASLWCRRPLLHPPPSFVGVCSR